MMKIDKDYAGFIILKTFGAVGTCWGSYMVVRMAAHPQMRAGVSMHPSHSNMMQTQLGEDEEEVLNEIQVHCTLSDYENREISSS